MTGNIDINVWGAVRFEESIREVRKAEWTTLTAFNAADEAIFSVTFFGTLGLSPCVTDDRSAAAQEAAETA